MGDIIRRRRAQRLCKLTSNPNSRSECKTKRAEVKTGEEFLQRPFQPTTEPFINPYIGLAYAVFYLWFEAFPLVFNDIYRMSQGFGLLPFIGIGALSYVMHTPYLNPKWERLGLAIVGGF